MREEGIVLTIAVVGLGHIGLPLAAQYASKGHRVRGCDINPTVVDMVNAGEAYPEEEGLSSLVRRAVACGLLSAETTTSNAVASADVVVVIVPLVIDETKQADYRSIDAATRDISTGLRPGTLVVYETTLPVGDTRRRFGPMLANGSGLLPGPGFSLAFSPERVYVGRVFQDLARYPKIVGGIDELSTQTAAAFYRSVLDASVVEVTNTETAEFCKLAETTYRDVNIALANEFARYAEQVGVDALQAIDAANTQPYSHIHRPGIGVGGHCIPVYPFFYANATEHAEIARTARRVNDDMALHAVERLETELGSLHTHAVAVLGFAYREDVKEDAFSVAARLIRLLEDRGAKVYVHDPMYSDDELRNRGLSPFSLSDPPQIDAMVLQAAHRAYRHLDLSHFPGLRVMLDGRNALSHSSIPPTVRYIGVGRDMPERELLSNHAATGYESSFATYLEDGATL